MKRAVKEKPHLLRLFFAKRFLIKVSLKRSVKSVDYIIEMLNIRKEFPGIVANDDVTLQVKKAKYTPFSVKTAPENRHS